MKHTLTHSWTFPRDENTYSVIVMFTTVHDYKYILQ